MWAGTTLNPVFFTVAVAFSIGVELVIVIGLILMRRPFRNWPFAPLDCIIYFAYQAEAVWMSTTQCPGFISQQYMQRNQLLKCVPLPFLAFFVVCFSAITEHTKYYRFYINIMQVLWQSQRASKSHSESETLIGWTEGWNCRHCEVLNCWFCKFVWAYWFFTSSSNVQTIDETAIITQLCFVCIITLFIVLHLDLYEHLSSLWHENFHTATMWAEFPFYFCLHMMRPIPTDVYVSETLWYADK